MPKNTDEWNCLSAGPACVVFGREQALSVRHLSLLAHILLCSSTGLRSPQRTEEPSELISAGAYYPAFITLAA